ncbi:PadR family transcriptional regulator [Actinoplanes sp. NPDC000266]
MSQGPVRITAPFLDVLEVFIAAGGAELHGWAIIKASHRGGPTVYKILERLDGMGWVSARWDDEPADPNKPRRRYYKLTGEGVTQAQLLLARHRPQRVPGSLRPALGGGPL